MTRIVVLCTALLLATTLSHSASPQANADEPKPKEPVNELVQFEGKFVSIKATNKRRQSYIFEFQPTKQLHGPEKVPTEYKKLLTFELYQNGGSDGGYEWLFSKLDSKLNQNPKAEDLIAALQKSPRYTMTFWRFSRDRVTPAALPVAIPE